MLTDVTLEKDMTTDIKIQPPSRRIFQASLVAAITFGLMGGTVWGLKTLFERRFNLQSARLTQWVQTHGQQFIDQHIQGMNALTNVYSASADVTLEQFDS